METAETLKLLAEHHLPALTPDDQRLLAARVCGIRLAEIAHRAGWSERQTRANVERILDLICLPAGIEHRDNASMGLWFALHMNCSHQCTAPALRMIRTDSVFGDHNR